jgi:hypothetical protein
MRRDSLLSHPGSCPADGVHLKLYYPTVLGLVMARNEPGMSADQIENLPATAQYWLAGAPTDDPTLLVDRVRVLLSRPVVEVGGLLPLPLASSAVVRQVEGTTTRFLRNPKVIACVVRHASGTCEVCNDPSPFRRSDGEPFLEVHHVRHLADGGPDTADNAIAICPNCHRELHHGVRREALRADVIAKTKRLVDHPIRALAGHLSETV